MGREKNENKNTDHHRNIASTRISSFNSFIPFSFLFPHTNASFNPHSHSFILLSPLALSLFPPSLAPSLFPLLDSFFSSPHSFSSHHPLFITFSSSLSPFSAPSSTSQLFPLAHTIVSALLSPNFHEASVGSWLEKEKKREAERRACLTMKKEKRKKKETNNESDKDYQLPSENKSSHCWPICGIASLLTDLRSCPLSLMRESCFSLSCSMGSSFPRFS